MGFDPAVPDGFHVKGARNFEVGGPEGDNGLSGKQLVVDAYGPPVPIGGGALSETVGPGRARGPLGTRGSGFGTRVIAGIQARFCSKTVPSVLYILMRHAAETEEATVRAVNDTHDNDTIAAVVGAAVGALHGEGALPRRWRQGLSGRTALDDDGRIEQTLSLAERTFAG